MRIAKKDKPMVRYVRTGISNGYYLCTKYRL